jgi:DNA repair ATPase RecN
MNLIRTAQQVALNDLLVATEKSADLLRDAADFLDGSQMEHELEQLAERRDMVTRDLQQAIRALDDMPSAPDPDAESTEKLLHRISAIFSGDKSRETTIRQRLATEEQLGTLLAEVQGRELGEEFDPLLYELKESIREVTLHLQQLLRRCTD